MKIRNPAFVDPITTFVATKKGAINAWLNGRQNGQRFVTADEIRAAFPADAAALTDGTIAEIVKALGLSVEP